MDDTTTPAPNADTDDPRGTDVGQGYPEENQPGTSPGGPPGPGHPGHPGHGPEQRPAEDA